MERTASKDERDESVACPHHTLLASWPAKWSPLGIHAFATPTAPLPPH